jgi:hypothetical protein
MSRSLVAGFLAKGSFQDSEKASYTSLTQALSNVEMDVFRLLKELYGVEKTKVTEEDRMVALENARKDQELEEVVVVERVRGSLTAARDVRASKSFKASAHWCQRRG